MGKHKTPGLDGLPVEFYIVFWLDICDLLVDSYNFSLKNGLLSLSQRNGIITLLPKRDKDLLDVKNHRPITLLSLAVPLTPLTSSINKLGVDLVVTLLILSWLLKGRVIGLNFR